jgi:hypothetical protein
MPTRVPAGHSGWRSPVTPGVGRRLGDRGGKRLPPYGPVGLKTEATSVPVVSEPLVTLFRTRSAGSSAGGRTQSAHVPSSGATGRPDLLRAMDALRRDDEKIARSIRATRRRRRGTATVPRLTANARPIGSRIGAQNRKHTEIRARGDSSRAGSRPSATEARRRVRAGDPTSAWCSTPRCRRHDRWRTRCRWCSRRWPNLDRRRHL